MVLELAPEAGPVAARSVTLLTYRQSTTCPALSLATMAKNIPNTSAKTRIRSQNAGKQQDLIIRLQNDGSFMIGVYYLIWVFLA